MSQLVPREPSAPERPALPEEMPMLPAVPYNPLLDIGKSASNLPMDDPDGKRIHDIALNGTHPAVADNVNLAFDLYAYVVHPYHIVDDTTGEVVERARLILVTHEGNCYQSGGYYTLESLARLVRSHGPGPWHPPIRVCIQSAPNKHGGRVYKLVPVVSESNRMPWQPMKEDKRDASKRTR